MTEKVPDAPYIREMEKYGLPTQEESIKSCSICGEKIKGSWFEDIYEEKIFCASCVEGHFTKLFESFDTDEKCRAFDVQKRVTD